MVTTLFRHNSHYSVHGCGAVLTHLLTLFLQTGFFYWAEAGLLVTNLLLGTQRVLIPVRVPGVLTKRSVDKDVEEWKLVHC